MRLHEEKDALVAEVEDVEKEKEKLAQELASARKEVKKVRKSNKGSREVSALKSTIEEMRAAAEVARETAGAEMLRQARGFSGRLEKRTERIVQLEAELRRNGVVVPEAKVRMGRPK